jgi:DNA-binding PadR family transcriptional regulator
VLSQAGLVRDDQQGARRVYRLQEDGVEAVRE